MATQSSRPPSRSEVDGDRLWNRLMEMATIAPNADGGSNRQALTDDDARGRELLLRWASAAGCGHDLDEIGNLFIRRPGLDPDAPPVLMGSHLDTQPTGGRFDGVYGVLGGMEVIDRLNDLGITTRTPIDLVVWTNEEGARFPKSMMGSGVWAGVIPLSVARDLRDAEGVTVGDELDRLGWSGARPAAPTPVAAAFELHIEQGPVLESEGVEIGVVTGVQGLRWYTLELRGAPQHAGPTPMDARRDPARAIAAILDDVYAMIDDHAPHARATFAQFRSDPLSPNTVPERLWCTLDLRHPEQEALDRIERRIRAIVRQRAEAVKVDAAITLENESPPVAFDRSVVETIISAAQRLGYSHRQIVSGAGHDACYVAPHAPTAMIFIPCEGGVSHNPRESITKNQAHQGASVLFEAVRTCAA